MATVFAVWCGENASILRPIEAGPSRKRLHDYLLDRSAVLPDETVNAEYDGNYDPPEACLQDVFRFDGGHLGVSEKVKSMLDFPGLEWASVDLSGSPVWLLKPQRLDCLDESASEFVRLSTGKIIELKKGAFVGNDVPEVFRVPKLALPIYCHGSVVQLFCEIGAGLNEIGVLTVPK